MIVAVASYKGGVGKTTSAIHLADYMADHGSVALLDGDQTRSATAWRERGNGTAHELPFPVMPIEAAVRAGRQYEHLVIDTAQQPSVDDLRALVQSVDLLIVPAVPSSLDVDGLGQTVRALQTIAGANYRVLITRAETHAAKAVAELRELLDGMDVPVFAAKIPEFKAFERAAEFGRCVRNVDEQNAARGWAAYQAAGEELGL